MKKLFFTFAAVCCALALSATTYTSHIKVTINGEVTEQDGALVEVVENEGAYTLTLKNFILQVADASLPVGNIEVANVQGVDEYGYTTIKFKDNIIISAGDDPAYSESDWVGPLLGDVPIDLTSRFTDTALQADIDIELAAMGQTIEVSVFGVAPASQALKGDVNEDGEVNISDVNNVIDIILTK